MARPGGDPVAGHWSASESRPLAGTAGALAHPLAAPVVQLKPWRGDAGLEQAAKPSGEGWGGVRPLSWIGGNAVQRRSADSGGSHSADDIHHAASEGVRTPTGAMPFAESIQRAFGRHDVSHIKAHTGDAATRSAHGMGASAFASGDHVVFAGQPDLHTAAHEAAHVVQQRAGVQLYGGVGREGDLYERHADAVADRVVAGGSAEGLLDQLAGPGRVLTPDGGGAVQRKPVKATLTGVAHLHDRRSKEKVTGKDEHGEDKKESYEKIGGNVGRKLKAGDVVEVDDDQVEVEKKTALSKNELVEAQVEDLTGTANDNVWYWAGDPDLSSAQTGYLRKSKFKLDGEMPVEGKEELPPGVMKVLKERDPETLKRYVKGKIDKSTAMAMAGGGMQLNNYQKVVVASELANMDPIRRRFYEAVLAKAQGSEWESIKRRSVEIRNDRYGEGKVGTAFRLLNTAAAIAGAIAAISGVVSLVCTILAPFTYGATAPVAAVAGLISAIASSVVVFLKLILIGRNVYRMARMPKADRSRVYPQLFRDIAGLIGATISVVMAGLGGDFGGSGVIPDSIFGETLGAMGEPLTAVGIDKGTGLVTDTIQQKVNKKAIKQEYQENINPTRDEDAHDKESGSQQYDVLKEGSIAQIASVLLAENKALSMDVGEVKTAQTDGEKIMDDIGVKGKQKQEKDGNQGAALDTEQLEAKAGEVKAVPDVTLKEEASDEQLKGVDQKLNEAGSKDSELAVEGDAVEVKKTSKKSAFRRKLESRVQKIMLKIRKKATDIAMKMPGLSGPMKDLKVGIEEDKKVGEAEIKPNLLTSEMLVGEVNTKIDALRKAAQERKLL